MLFYSIVSSQGMRQLITAHGLIKRPSRFSRECTKLRSIPGTLLRMKMMFKVKTTFAQVLQFRCHGQTFERSWNNFLCVPYFKSVSLAQWHLWKFNTKLSFQQITIIYLKITDRLEVTHACNHLPREADQEDHWVSIAGTQLLRYHIQLFHLTSEYTMYIHTHTHTRYPVTKKYKGELNENFQVREMNRKRPNVMDSSSRRRNPWNCISPRGWWEQAGSEASGKQRFLVCCYMMGTGHHELSKTHRHCRRCPVMVQTLRVRRGRWGL